MLPIRRVEDSAIFEWLAGLTPEQDGERHPTPLGPEGMYSAHPVLKSDEYDYIDDGGQWIYPPTAPIEYTGMSAWLTRTKAGRTRLFFGLHAENAPISFFEVTILQLAIQPMGYRRPGEKGRAVPLFMPILAAANTQLDDALADSKSRAYLGMRAIKQDGQEGLIVEFGHGRMLHCSLNANPLLASIVGL